MSLYYIYILPLFASVCASLTTVRLAWPRPYRWFAAFLTTTLLVELAAYWWSASLHAAFRPSYSVNNVWLYNLYLVPQYLFYIYFFAANQSYRWLKRAGGALAVLYASAVAYNLFYRQHLFVVDGGNMILSSFIILFLTTVYFVQLIRSREVVLLHRQPLFWIATGCFIFHLGSLPCFMLYRYIADAASALATSLFRIIVSLNCVMYSLYTVAFLCTKKYPRLPS